MRLLLLTGKGGVGKTTLAAATGAALAARGSRTRDGVRAQLRAALVRGAGLDGLEAEELTVIPGVDELLALSEVQRLAGDGRWDTVVVDCGPTAETLRLLALPDAVSAYVRRMAGPLGKRSGLARSLEALADRTGSLRDLLTDPARTAVRLVFTPERVVVAETRRTLTALALRGIRVDGMIANRVMPAPGWWRGAAASWVRTRRAQQDEVLAELGRSGFGTAAERLRTVEHRAAEPVGLDALRAIAEELYGSSDPLGDAAGDGGTDLAPLLRMTATDAGYQLRVAVPLARDSVVDLARVDDDLAITVDGVRRLIALPEPLRACRITDAESDSRGVLVHLEGTE
ncbi:arsenic ABC transporter ATPase [Streptomyces regensis]|nr:arsenic ABC transporter ATPase [Streptomyces regensis]